MCARTCAAAPYTRSNTWHMSVHTCTCAAPRRLSRSNTRHMHMDALYMHICTICVCMHNHALHMGSIFAHYAHDMCTYTCTTCTHAHMHMHSYHALLEGSYSWYSN